ncbi:MAG TPA: hypothetical protein VGS58_07640, partial [Candidatus Sulfopaludibacter sp.]|nr:hypothetical protein [Candidatus Sulfopaludibacter sp.]
GGAMSGPDREQQLADALAEALDRREPRAATQTHFPELAPELAALAEIDGIPDAATGAGLPDRLSGHKVLEEIGSGGMGRVRSARRPRNYWPPSLPATAP